jgi:uracil-DNA glycosylase
MSDATVYLEDIQVTKKEQKPLATATNAGVKRQRTLQDMFAPGKRQKGADGAAFVPTRFTATKNSQKLNAIPFSLSAFVESLSPDDRALLALECEVMGKSWFVV